MSYGSQTRNPYELDDHLSCDFGCEGEADFVQVDGHRTPLCGACETERTDTCTGCNERFWIGQLTATFKTSNLYCPVCDEEHRAAAQLIAERDDFNEARR